MKGKNQENKVFIICLVLVLKTVLCNKCLRIEIRTVGTKNKHCLMNQHKKGEKNNIFWHIIGIIFKACRVAKIPR